MPYIIVAVFFCLIVIPSAFASDIQTATYLRDSCKKAIADYAPNNTNTGFCFGKISTLLDVSYSLEKDIRFCPPDNVTTGQMIEVFIKYINDNPKYLNESSTSVAIIAYKNTWPCR